MTRSATIAGAMASLALAWGVAVPAHAQTTYYINGGAVQKSGAQLWIGNGLPLPVDPDLLASALLFQGKVFPPLLIPAQTQPPPTAMQTGSFPQTLRVPLGAFLRVPGEPNLAPIAQLNPSIWQIRTNIAFSGPGFPNNPPGTSVGPSTNNPPGTGTSSVTLSAGRRTGPKTAAFSGLIPGSKVVYSKSLHQFGGPAQIKLAPLTDILVWAHAAAQKAPCKHTSLMGADAGCVALLARAEPGSGAAPGAPVGFSTATPGNLQMSPGALGVYVRVAGTIVSQTTVGMTGVINKASSSGFPWTTGMLTIDDGGGALATPEMFILTGQDNRTAGGVGTLSIVSAALSNRTLSGPNANRGWARYILPEPAAVLGAAAALAALGVCRVLARRGSR